MSQSALYILVASSLPCLLSDMGPKMLSLFTDLSYSPSTSIPGFNISSRSFNWSAVLFGNLAFGETGNKVASKTSLAALVNLLGS